MKRFIYVISLLTSLWLSTYPQNAFGQTIVTDVQNTATNTLNGIRATTDAFSQLTSLFESLDIASEHMAKFAEFKQTMANLTEDIANAQRFINEVNDFVGLFRALESNIMTLKMYGEMIKTSAGEKFNEYYLSNLLNQTVAFGNTAQSIVETITAIINEKGLTKWERQQLIAQKRKEAEDYVRAMRENLMKEMMNLQNLQQSMALVNFSYGLPAEAGLKGYGAEKTDLSQATSSTELSSNLRLAEKGASVSEVMDGGNHIRSVIYTIILVVIGISCLGSLIFAFAKFATGTPEADKMFARIFVLVIIILVVFSIISQFVFGTK